MSNIWTPAGSVLPPEVRTAQEAVEAYDARLELGYDQRNEQWVVLWKDGPDGAPFPALGLGRELPGYEEIQRRLYSGDVARRGAEVLKEVIDRNEARKRASRAELSERAGEVAEALEHTFRRMGKTSYTKVFLPGRDFTLTP
jgi:hypothetical protein